MKYFKGIIFLFVIVSHLSMATRAIGAPKWEELKGDHFIIYFTGDEAKFAAQVLKAAEKYYKRISKDLGYQRYSNFWQWDNRVKIYAYPNQKSFVQATGAKEWSHGLANYTDKEIFSYVWEDGFVDSLLPHEITHLMFRDYVGFEGEIPLWLDEGVAQWQELEKRRYARQVMKAIIKDRKALSIDRLTGLDVRQVSDPKTVGIFYVQAVSLVDFLVEKYGSKSFIIFCRQLRDGKTLNDALRFSYPTSMRNLTEMEEKWIGYIVKAPQEKGFKVVLP